MSNITIRQYNLSDLEWCRSLWVELTQHHRDIYDDQSIGGGDPGIYFDRHLARVGSERIWVAECDGGVVGLAGLIVDDPDAEIDPVIISKEYRGRGIGSAMVDRMVEEAKRIGVRYFSVKPVARNLDAIEFYHKSGFRIIGQVELFMDISELSKDTWKSGIELFGRNFRF